LSHCGTRISMKRHRAIRFWSLLYPVFVSFTLNSGFSREQGRVADESLAADSMLIIGMVNNGATAQFNLPGKFGNRIIDSTPDVERAIEQALKSREPSTDITLVAEVNYFRLNKAEYFVRSPSKFLACNSPTTDSQGACFWIFSSK
jgi:hypothetical protein